MGPFPNFIIDHSLNPAASHPYCMDSQQLQAGAGQVLSPRGRGWYPVLRLAPRVGLGALGYSRGFGSWVSVRDALLVRKKRFVRSHGKQQLVHIWKRPNDLMTLQCSLLGPTLSTAGSAAAP